jgi:hypothetical protein
MYFMMGVREEIVVPTRLCTIFFLLIGKFTVRYHMPKGLHGTKEIDGEIEN